MIRGFWIPTNWKRAALLLVLFSLLLLRQSELVGLMGSTVLLFGWLPLQIAYDVTIGLVAVVLTYGLYLEAPEPPVAFEPASRSGSSTGGETDVEGGD